ncbi:MAG TPA: hypothetical protein VNY05_45475 [Candidatus Acidoferrales bacterium]|jgi:hypothetical protein|nr:hypothetical protein [Candidatus Acidoferrales bacterium]
MKKELHTLLPAGFATLALLAVQAPAQTQYAVSILPVPAPYLGGNVSSINNGVAAGSAYTNCQGKLGCVSLLVPMAWPTLGAALDLTRNTNVQLSSAIQAVQPNMFGGYDTEGGTTHAILINPLLAGHIDLNSIFFASKVLAMCPGYQAGYAQTTPVTSSGGGSSGVTWHAMLWFGDPNSWVDLHNQMDVSQVTACDGNVQVGWAGSRSFTQHAVMWTGSRTSEIDLHSGASQSDQALGVSGNTQVGWGAFLDHDTRQEFAHALLWHGAPNTLTDIHPAAYQNSQAFAAAGNKQVGFAVNGNDPVAPGTYHGLLWFGTAASVIDLNQFLPAGYTDAQVDAIDSVTGIIAGAAKGPKGVFEPAVWIPVAQ